MNANRYIAGNNVYYVNASIKSGDRDASDTLYYISGDNRARC